MDKELYDIFISYRRAGGFETAKHLYDLLSNDGYTVSFDIDTLREGDFDSTLLNRIDQCTDFILVVDQHTFDRTLDTNFDPKKDWLRIELAYALRMRKNVIPVLLSGVNGFPENLPEDIKAVETKNGPEYNKYYFDEFYKKLKSFLHCLPRNLGQNSKSVAFVTIQAKENYNVLVDGSNICAVKAGELKKVEVELGEHVFVFSPLDASNKSIVVKREFSTPKNYVLDISAYNKGNIQRKLLYLFGIVLSIGLIAFASLRIIEFLNDREMSEVDEEETVINENVEISYCNSTLTVNGVSYEFATIHGAEFIMGSVGLEECYEHPVTLGEYKIGKTEIPQSIWEAIMGNNPSKHKGPNYPVENVSWNDCQDFIQRINKLTNQRFRLPTEAEWEYAANEGFSEDDIQQIAWYEENSNKETHAIATKNPNGFSLYDTSGNVWEWCNDWYDKYSRNEEHNPQGPSTGEAKVYRGGGCGNDVKSCSPKCRGGALPEEKADALGLRLAM